MGQSELIFRSREISRWRPPSRLLLYALQVAKKIANVRHPLCNLKGFLFVIVALQVARKIASGNMAFSRSKIRSVPTVLCKLKVKIFPDPYKRDLISKLVDFLEGAEENKIHAIESRLCGKLKLRFCWKLLTDHCSFQALRKICISLVV